jgi:hypothetical protein
LGPSAQQDPIVLDLVAPDLKHFKKGVGFGCPARLTDHGFGWAARPNILGSGCAAIPNDIIICIINILNFIIINIKNFIICIINFIFYF